MRLAPLPVQVTALLEQLAAPPRLVAHLTLVHDVACRIITQFDLVWPRLAYDRDVVRLGAALHDIGKVQHPAELTASGQAHLVAGEQLLLAAGFPIPVACIARTHEQWRQEAAVALEDVLVALADTWWRGKRDTALENAIAERIQQQTGMEPWRIFLALDDSAIPITADADARLAWQNQFPA